MSDKFTDYKLPDTAYTTFDAESLKSLIVQRLQEDGTFTDQVYEGSNMSAFIDVIAYSYHVLMYYLNRTSSESLFTESTIYENINRIVKLLNYNPVGYQTSSLMFKMFGSSDLVPGTYTLPRYSYINSNGIAYSTDRDISFTKNTDLNEEFTNVGEKNLLYQGMWIELSSTAALGEPFESLVISPPEKSNIDHFHVHIYVQDVNTGKYYEYKETPSMYLKKPFDRCFEKRLNEKEMYEIKFGNDITGAKLNPGDTIQIYYLKSDGETGMVGPNFLDEEKLVMFGTSTFNKIKQDTKPQNIDYMTFDNTESIYFSNNTPSTLPQQRESVRTIKEKAPLYFVSQDRLVTVDEFETHINKNYGGVISTVKVVDNTTYMDGHFKYLLEDIGVSDPNLESRNLYNQLNVSTSTNFNNVYIYAVPKVTVSTSNTVMTNFLAPAQKELILNDINNIKMVSHEAVLIDPVYVAIGLGATTSTENITPTITDNTTLQVKRTPGTMRDDDAIRSEITNLIGGYFTNATCTLGQTIDLNALGNSIMLVDGVDEIRTYREDLDTYTTGLSICIWNPVYISDIDITNQNIKLPYFKYPYLHDAFNFYKKVIVIE